MNTYKTIPYKGEVYDEEELVAMSDSYYEWLNKRRTVRDFSDQPIPLEVIQKIVLSASTAPSGAHKQPWSFCVVSNPEIKKKIRQAAEKEEKESYNGRMTEEWLEDLAPLGTDWQKPFLETAPYLIIVFKRIYELKGEVKRNNYYVSESVGIACGFLLTAIHNAGLVALTHTPSPMNFLSKLLNRPENERPFLLIPVGYSAVNALVPDLRRKDLDEVLFLYD